jgi:hypothetical protein
MTLYLETPAGVSRLRLGSPSQTSRHGIPLWDLAVLLIWESLIVLVLVLRCQPRQAQV